MDRRSNVDEISLSRAVNSLNNDLEALGDYSRNLDKKIKFLNHGSFVFQLLFFQHSSFMAVPAI